jgi:cellulose synthase/poly-beta-1,6-N-acetylglucosamine synthase-like glycosyltransferase
LHLSTILLTALTWLLVVMVLTGVLPLAMALHQYLLIPLHFRRNHYAKCRPWYPRTVIVIAAWNEGAVIGTTVDRFMRLDYPRDALRVAVVDDASTDETPQVLQAKVAQYPGRVFHIRRERGGEGKGAALNAGLRFALADGWMQALLIGDADPIFEPPALRRMARHLADPQVGAVTAYIKEGSSPANFVNKFIAYEYITGQAATRRSQNVFGLLFCLAGGAQLHSRANIEALGGQIDNSTLAEDTLTTIETQRRGRKALFEPHAVVWAEEPGGLQALWKQRLRWARGNVQLTLLYRRMWFRRQPGSRLGSATYALNWFAILGQPLFMLWGSAALVALYFLDTPLAWHVFGLLWLTNAISYAFITCYTLLVDPQVGRRTWVQALLFPGIINVVVMTAAVFTAPMHWLAVSLLSAFGIRVTSTWVLAGIMFMYLWLAGAMGVAYLAMLAESRPAGGVLSRVLVYLGGFGPLMCAVTLTSYVKELRGAEARWDKTEKTGKVVVSA